MRVVLAMVALAACSSRREEAAPRTDVETVRVPTAGAPARATPPPGGNRAAAEQLTPDEGTLEIEPPTGSRVGAPATARVRVHPGKGFHINTEYTFVVSLQGAPGLEVAKARLEGGKRGALGDAETLEEKELSIPITLTPTAAGPHELRGTILFGICRNDACLQREMPIAVTVAAT